MRRTTPQPVSVHPQNSLNGLPGNRWLYFTRSVLKTNYGRELGFELRQSHGANKPPQLMREFIEFFTIKKELVLDPFAGVGGTLLGASLCNRKAIGIEISKEWVSIYEKVCKTERFNAQKVYVGDCIAVMEGLRDKWKNKFHLILTDPPYGPSLDRTMCNGKYSNRNRASTYNEFSTSVNDFSNSKTLDEYLERMKSFLSIAYEVLKDNRYLVLITRPQYKDGEYVMVPSSIAGIAKQTGFALKGEIIWHQNGTRLRPYGYPFVFVPNIIHHNILVLRKEVDK